MPDTNRSLGLVRLSSQFVTVDSVTPSRAATELQGTLGQGHHCEHDADVHLPARLRAPATSWPA